MEKVLEKFGEDKVAVLTINDDRSAITRNRALSKVNTSLPVLVDKELKAVKAYRAYIRPSLFLIDQQQRIYNVWTGKTDDLEAELTKNIQFLLRSGRLAQGTEVTSSSEKM